MPSPRTIRVTRRMAAPPATVFELLADPRKHALFDGSGTVTGVNVAPARLALGATFSMHMRMKLGYVTRNHVVVFEEGRAIAWHHAARFIWRYDLEAVDGGTTYGDRDLRLQPAVGLRHRMVRIPCSQSRRHGGDLATTRGRRYGVMGSPAPMFSSSTHV